MSAIKSDLLVKIAIFHTRLHSTTMYPRNIAVTFGVEKLELYSTVKNFDDGFQHNAGVYMTDGHLATA